MMGHLFGFGKQTKSTEGIQILHTPNESFCLETFAQSLETIFKDLVLHLPYLLQYMSLVIPFYTQNIIILVTHYFSL